MQALNKSVEILFIVLLVISGCSKKPAGFSLQGGVSRTTNAPVRLKPVVNRDYYGTLSNLLDNARDEILVAHFEYHYDFVIARIQKKLAAAVRRGVKVRVLIEDELDFNQESLPHLLALGIKARLDTPKYRLHSKLFVVDKRFVLIGSTNLSGRSINDNNETNILIDNPDAAKYFTDFFEYNWNGSNNKLKTGIFKSNKLKAFTNRQYVSQVLPMINKASKRVYVLMYVMKHYPDRKSSITNKMINALIKAKKRGLDVRVTLDKSDYDKTLNKINSKTVRYLKKNGIIVVYDPPKTITHAKLVIIDDSVVIGSTNWGYSGFTLYNGVNVIANDEKITEAFLKYFRNIRH